MFGVVSNKPFFLMSFSMRSFLYAFAAFGLFIAGPSFATDVPPSFADLVDKLSPAVVNISTTQKVKGGMQGFQFDIPEGGEGGEQIPDEMRKFFEQFGKQQQGGKEMEHEVHSLGSGFIIDPDGYIATNNHVIGDAGEVSVTLADDTKLKAKIIGRDTKTDLALLKVEAGHKLPFVTLGDSDTGRVGDWIIAIGDPYTFGGTVTAGIISARGRNINAGQYDDFIQTDAPINKGNSGGPMFNMKGEVIGINTAIFSPSGGSVGIGFAIPTSLAKPVLTQLRAHGHIDRGWLGVKIQDVTDEIADSVGLKKAEGALVMEVTKDSPADKAGIKIGDIITHFDGKEIRQMRNLPRMVADTPIGKAVNVDVWRKGETKTVAITLGQLKEKEEAENSEGGEDEDNGPSPTIKGREVLGMTVSPITPEVREKFGVTAGIKGVLVTKLKEESEAAKRGLQAGDIITQVGETPIEDAKALSDAVANARSAGRKFLLLRVTHGTESLFVTLPVEEKKEKKEE
jgi:serine protease Do